MENLSHFYSGTNRIVDRVPTIAAAIDGLTDEARATFAEEMAVTPAEIFGYQNAQARAFAAGRISQDEAMTIHNALGWSGWRKGTSLALQVAITLAVTELLVARR